MKKIVVFLAVIFAVSFFSSCEKEVKEKSELKVTVQTGRADVEEIQMVLVDGSQQVPVHYFDNVKVGLNKLSLQNIDLNGDTYYISTILFDQEGKYLDQRFTEDFPIVEGEVNEVDVKFK
jgi:thioredoxin-related protein